MGRGRHFGKTAIAIATVSLGTSGVFAQTVNPDSPVSITLDLTTRFEVDDNRDLDPVSAGTTYDASETLTFGFRSETSVQVLNLTAAGALRYLDRPVGGTSFGFDNANVRLGYSRQVSNSDINFSAFYRESDVVDAFEFSDGLFGGTSTDLIAGVGTVAITGANLNYQIGLSDPFGVSFFASWYDRDYSNTIDPDLFDTTSTTIGADASFRFSPNTSGNLELTNIRETSDNVESTETDTTSLIASLSHELRRGLTLGASLGFREIDTTEFGITTTTDGLLAGVDAVQDLANGSIFGGISFDGSDDEDELALTFGRSLDLRDGALTASLEIVDGELSGVQYLGNLDYSKELPRGALSVGLTQSIDTNSDDDEEKLSELRIAYSQEITTVSDLNFGLDMSRSEDGGIGSATTRDRASFTASYSRELTADWDLAVGYRHRRFQEAGAPTANSNSVFLTLSRAVALGF